MKQKLISLFALVVFFTSFGYFFGDDYWKYQESQKQKQVFQSEVTMSHQDFSLETLPTFGEDISLYMTPDLSLRDRIVSQMDTAKEKIYVEVYIFTEKKMREALLRAHLRGVKVQVLLENNPYQAPSLNDDTFEILENAGIDVRWSDPLLYSLNHSKLLIIDQQAYISTGNFSYSLFTSNKDFLVEIQTQDMREKLESLFQTDFIHNPGGVIDQNLVISPYNSREKLEYFLRSAKKSIDFYFPYLQDESLENILFEKAAAGVQIRGIVEKAFYEENPDIISRYREKSVLLFPLKKYKLHAKMVLVDGKYLYLGSINFSRYSMDENRELGIILQERDIISQMQKIFISDL